MYYQFKNKLNIYFSVIEDYCLARNAEIKTFSFKINGVEVLEDHTPESVNMIKGNRIDVIKR